MILQEELREANRVVREYGEKLRSGSSISLRNDTVILKEEKDLFNYIEQIITNVLYLSSVAKTEGLLSLEENVCRVQNKFLSWLLRQIVDGTDPDLLKDLIINKYYANNLVGLEALEFLLYMYGGLLIQEGTLIYVIEVSLKSMLCDYIVDNISDKIASNVV